MEAVNALKVRNHLGEILDRLNATGEPILISKGRKIRGVLITPEQFEKRFVDWQAHQKKSELLEKIRGQKLKRHGNRSSIEILRQLRGYDR